MTRVRQVARGRRRRPRLKNLPLPWIGFHTGTMDLPRAEIRYHGMAAVAAAIVRRVLRFGAWIRPRLAPLLITALATACMFAGLDLIAHDIHARSHHPEPPDTMTVYLMSEHDLPQLAKPAPDELIDVELTAPPRCDLDTQCFTPPDGIGQPILTPANSLRR